MDIVKEIYFDNSATTRINKLVLEKMIKAYDKYGNPSSLHKKGIEAEKQINAARESVSNSINAEKEEIYFTSGGTESNNLAIKGIAYRNKKRGDHLITSKIEHPSVLETFRSLEKEGFKVSYLDVESNGLISLENLEREITSNTTLVSIMMVNNEIGTIQPIKDIGKLLKDNYKKVLFHVDAVQAFGKLPIDVYADNVDLLSISSHKIHGPLGVGALFVKKGVNIIPNIYGGGQEAGFRSGTENVPGIVGFGAASEIIEESRKNSINRIKNIKHKIYDGIIDQIDCALLNGPDINSEISSPNIMNISFIGFKGEIIVHAMEDKKIFLSTGSACSSKNVKTNYVLNALGCQDERINGSIRFSFSYNNNENEAEICIKKLEEVISDLKFLVRRS